MHENEAPTPADGGGGTRMTYAEIAERLGVSDAAARQLVRRRRWRRIMPNHPSAPAYIVVPPDGLHAEVGTKPRSPSVDPPDAPDISSTVKAFEAALASLREDRDREIGRLRDEHGRLVAVIEVKARDAEQRAERAEAALSGERAKGDVLRDRLDTLQGELREAREAVEVAVERANRLARADQAAEALRADNAEQEVEAERSRADSLWGRLEAAQAELKQAQEAAEAARQAEGSRQARGRLRRAWDGWRGR
jgi:hypothetical protein